jgi:hypothetical protein
VSSPACAAHRLDFEARERSTKLAIQRPLDGAGSMMDVYAGLAPCLFLTDGKVTHIHRGGRSHQRMSRQPP